MSKAIMIGLGTVFGVGVLGALAGDKIEDKINARKNRGDERLFDEQKKGGVYNSFYGGKKKKSKKSKKPKKSHKKKKGGKKRRHH